MDDTVRYPDIPDDKVYGVTTVEDALKILNEKIDVYNSRHEYISE